MTLGRDTDFGLNSRHNYYRHSMRGSQLWLESLQDKMHHFWKRFRARFLPKLRERGIYEIYFESLSECTTGHDLCVCSCHDFSRIKNAFRRKNWHRNWIEEQIVFTIVMCLIRKRKTQTRYSKEMEWIMFLSKIC